MICKHSRRRLISLIAIVALASRIVYADTSLPDIGQSAATVLTPAEERRTGEAVVRNIRRAGGILDDPLLTEYINTLGYRLLANAENPDHHPFQFFIVNDNSINAFALPGGFIGVNYGLIMKTDSENELASVLAHEVVHVTQRHHARAYENAGNTQLPVLAAIIAAIILGSKGNELGQAALTSAAAGAIQNEINFTRHNEEEADRIGIQMLAKAGMDANGMANFFDKLDKESRLQGFQLPDFLRTHPVNTQRISDAQSRAAQLPKVKSADTLNYTLMKQRLIAMTSENLAGSQQSFEQALITKDENNVSAQHYGYALVLLRLGKYAQAESEIKILLQRDPHRIAYLLARADVLVKSGQVQAALRSYEAALKIYPNNTAITYDYVATLLQHQYATKAKTVLARYLKSPPINPQFYQFRARAEAATSNKVGSHEAMAEYYYAMGQLHPAADQLEIALKLPGLDFYALSRLEARLAQIKSEIVPLAHLKNG